MYWLHSADESDHSKDWQKKHYTQKKFIMRWDKCIVIFYDIMATCVLAFIIETACVAWNIYKFLKFGGGVV